MTSSGLTESTEELVKRLCREHGEGDAYDVLTFWLLCLNMHSSPSTSTMRGCALQRPQCPLVMLNLGDVMRVIVHEYAAHVCMLSFLAN